MRRYIHRAIEKEIVEASREFPVVVLTGPRQTGKSTLLQKLFPKHRYVTLDDPFAARQAAVDPEQFLSICDRVIIDEIQYAPELLRYIKIAVDRDRRNAGRFILTGSQYFPLMKGVVESLAGRIALYELLPFSAEEMPARRHLSSRDNTLAAIFGGFYPEIIAQGAGRDRFYAAYLRTYLERDIRQISSVHDLRVFQNFLELLAARAGGLLNVNELAKDAGISFTSARRWISLLESTRIIYLLRPFARNITKRIVKSPKVYFTDTGLLTYLLKYQDAVTMGAGPQAGAFFENLACAEILKCRYNHNVNFEPYFYRDSNHNEVDFVLDFGTACKAIEVKMSATLHEKQVASFAKMVGMFRGGRGYIVSFAGTNGPIEKSVESISWTALSDVIRFTKFS